MSNSLIPAWLEPPVDANALAPGLWPSTARRDDSGVLSVGGVSVAQLAAEFGTPLYVYDEDDVRGAARRMRDVFDSAAHAAGTHAHVYYASKAFLSAAVVRWVRDEGLRLDVASSGELEVALAAGMNPAHIGLHGNNKSDAELLRAASVGVGSIVIDSAEEVQRVARAAATVGTVQRVRLRVNSGVHASTHEYLATAREDQKFGVSLDQAASIAAAIRAESSLEFLGLHSHIGSQIFGVAGFREAATRLLTVHADLLSTGPVPELNLGGGFGIAYTRADVTTDIADIANAMLTDIAGLCAEHDIPVPAIAVEPGRSIVGRGGITLYTVGTIKPVGVTLYDGSTQTRTYVSVDGGMSDNMRTALYKAEYSALLASRASNSEPIVTRIVGKHCESGDIVVLNEFLPGDIHRDDLVAIPATGAYCASLANNYNFLMRPAVVSVRGGEARLMVRRDTVADLLERDMEIGKDSQ